MKKLLLFILLSIFMLNSLQAAYLTNVPRTVKQPNGTILHCFISGDEYHHWLHDANGFTIIQDVTTGYYVYADKEQEKLIPTKYIAGITNPVAVGLKPNLNISTKQWQAQRQTMEQAMSLQHKKSITDYKKRNLGKINNIVIFIRFSDDTTFKSSFSDVDKMLNSADSGANSMFNYFKSASYDKLEIYSHFYPTPDDDVVLSYQDIHPRSYYQEYSETDTNGYKTEEERTLREHTLLERAVIAVSESIPSSLNIDYNNDGRVDNVCFVVKGSVGDWSSLLWPHRWALYSQNVYIGSKQVWDYNFQLEDPNYFRNTVMCHEMFHTLGAPDLYHYEEDYRNLHAVGPWDLMAQNTTIPQHSGAYMKLIYGNWLDSIQDITLPGTYTLYPINSETPKQLAYAIASEENPQEIFVLEYRKKSAPFEESIPGSGLIIYRINLNFIGRGNSQYNGDDKLDEVYIYRPDGTLTENGDIRNAFFCADSGRINFDILTTPQPVLSNGITISNLKISDITFAGDSIQFTYGVNNTHLAVDKDTLILESSVNSSGNFKISGNNIWNIAGTPSWLHISDTIGFGNANIQLHTIEENLSFQSRFGELIISSDTLNDTIIVVQKRLNPILNISQPTINIGAFAGDSATFEITSNIDWEITDITSWLQLSQTSGNGNAIIRIEAKEANNNNATRSCNLTFSGEEVATKHLLVTQSFTTDIMDITENKELILYPNPAKDKITVICHNTGKKGKLILCNNLGQIVYESLCTFDGTNKIIDISKIERGIYILHLIIDNQAITKKIIIE